MTKRRVFTDTLPLGTPVSFTHELQRKEVDTKPDEPTEGPSSVPFAASRFQQHWLPVERTGVGFVMGYRSLTNGYTDVFSDGEWGYESQVRAWVNVSNTPAALVAFDLFRKPVLVPIDALTPTQTAVPLVVPTVDDFLTTIKYSERPQLVVAFEVQQLCARVCNYIIDARVGELREKLKALPVISETFETPLLVGRKDVFALLDALFPKAAT